MINHNGEEYEKECVYIHTYTCVCVYIYICKSKSLCYTTEINTTLKLTAHLTAAAHVVKCAVNAHLSD